MSRSRNWKHAAGVAALALTFILMVASNALAQHYTRTDLTTDNSSVTTAPNIDPNLVNPWGMSRSSGSPWWISHHLDYAQVDFTGLAFASHSDLRDAATISNSGRIVSLPAAH